MLFTPTADQSAQTGADEVMVASKEKIAFQDLAL